MDSMTLRRCYVCKQEKPLEEFGRNRGKKDGRADACRVCEAKRRREWKRNHPLTKDQSRIDSARKKARRVERGVCIACGKPNNNPGRKTCKKCLLKMSVRWQQYKLKNMPSLCVICGFEYPDVHHIDGNHENNDPSNRVCLCPNHHRLVHLGLLTL